MQPYILHYGSGTCCICLEDINCGFKLNNCHHLFHAYCITAWLKNNSTCPMCRTYVYNLKKPWYYFNMNWE